MSGTVALAAAAAIIVALQPPEIWPIAAPFVISLGSLSRGRLLD